MNEIRITHTKSRNQNYNNFMKFLDAQILINYPNHTDFLNSMRDFFT